MLHLSAALAQAEEEGAASRGREALQYLLRVADAHAQLAGWGGVVAARSGEGGRLGEGRAGRLRVGRGLKRRLRMTRPPWQMMRPPLKVRRRSLVFSPL